MIYFRLFGFLAITLCLVACLCTSASVSEHQASETVRIAKKSASAALNKAQSKYTKAQDLKRTLEERKNKAENAALGAAAAANGNSEAAAIAEKAENAWQSLLRLYPDAKTKAENAFNPINDLFVTARRLDIKADIQLLPDTGSLNDYTKVNANASSVKSDAEQLEKDVDNTISLYNTANAALSTLSVRASEAQIAKYQVDAVVALAKIKTMSKEADVDIQSIKQERDKVNSTVKAIRKLLDNSPQKSIQRINDLLTSVEGNLRAMLTKDKEVIQAKKTMVEQEEYACTDVEDIKEENNEVETRKKFQTVEHYVKKSKESHEKIKKILREAKTSVINANYRKQDADNVVLQNAEENGITQDKETQQTDLSEEEAPALSRKSATVKTTIINSEKPVSKGTGHQSDNKPDKPLQEQAERSTKSVTVNPTLINVEKTISGAPEKLMHQSPNKPTIEQTEQLKRTNSEILKEKLHNHTQKVTTIPVIGGSVPEVAALIDNSITVSVSLLLALIVSAVLH